MKDDDLIDELRLRLKSAMEWEAYTRPLNIDDVKFGTGDSDNMYQWPNAVAKDRKNAGQPMLTTNKTRIHCMQIVNEAKQNKVAIKISPTGDGATAEAAEIFDGIIRSIEYQSQAQDAYSNSLWWNVFAGVGYTRIVTEYVDDKSFDQEIYIRPVKDPMSVYLDPDIMEADGSDAKWGLIYEDIPRWQFDKQYPKYKDITADPLLSLSAGMKSSKHVRVVEYYRRTPKADLLIGMKDGTTLLKSEMKDAPEIIEKLLEGPGIQTRKVMLDEVEWFKVAGGCVISKGIWPSKYIPIIREVAEETVIDGQYDRKSHVRPMKDPQRAYNYWNSSATEMVALQPKSPFIGPMEAFDGLETYWNEANVSSRAWLPFNAYDQQGRPIPQPARQAPPVMAEAHLMGMKVAAEDMQLVSGQHEEQFGQESNAQSGVAIDARQRRGDLTTYHFIDSQASARRYTGRILIDMIPRVYDIGRIKEIMAEDGSQKSVQIDPEHPDSFTSSEGDEASGEDASIIFNPKIGRYAAQADVGPSYGTRRQETFQGILQLMNADKNLTPIVGDLLMRAADFPMAKEVAERLKNMVPAQALGGPSQEMQAMQGQLAQATAAVQKLLQEMTAGDAKSKLQIDEYRAETDRMNTISKVDPEALKPIIRQMIGEAMGIALPDLQAMHGITPAPHPVPQQAPPPLA